MELKNLIYALLIAVPTQLHAQTTVTFEDGDTNYKSVGVYDARWEQSPFRTNAIDGSKYAAVVDNPQQGEAEVLGYAPNATSRVLAVQRSRFGSNTFGARIDLSEPFDLGTTTQYVRAMIYRPAGVKSSVMLVGLGKRENWPAQSEETEQFWERSTSELTEGEWNDCVFAIKSNQGVKIHSLVIVPDLESPHELTSDFVVYIDEIEYGLNTATPRFQVTNYPLNYNKTATKGKHYFNSISLSGGADGTQTIDHSAATTSYTNLTETKLFHASPGETLTAAFTGGDINWMNAYVYIDYSNDGKFDVELESNKPTATGELVAFSFLGANGGTNNDSGNNSAGTSISGNGRNTCSLPSFKIPEAITSGIYRIRFKLDWNSSDPGGNTGATNGEGLTFIDYGGEMVDALIDIHSDKVIVNDSQLNGDVLAQDGTPLKNYEIDYGESLTIKMKPENGFAYDGVVISYGYTGDDLYVKDNRQYFTTTVNSNAFNADDEYTIPAAYLFGRVNIEGLMVEKGKEQNFDYPVNFDKTMNYTRSDRHLNAVTLAGKTVNVDQSKMYYEDLGETFVLKTRTTYSPTFNYTGTAMSGYLYLDRGQDGDFNTSLATTGRPTTTSDVLSYGHYDSKNSNGSAQTTFMLNPPSFRLTNIANGFYRLRFKVDWNSIDPGGNTASNNLITNNAGAIADFRVCVYDGDSVDVSVINSDGCHLMAEDVSLDGTKVAFNKELTLHGLEYVLDSISVRHGLLSAEQPVVHTIAQYETDTFLPESTGIITIPAEKVDGDLEITPYFSNVATGIRSVNLEDESGVIYDVLGRRATRTEHNVVYIQGRKKMIK